MGRVLRYRSRPGAGRGVVCPGAGVFPAAAEPQAGDPANRRERLDGAARQIRKRGGLLLITARFIPGGRTILTISSGVTGQPRGWFAGWVAVAGLVWATYAAGLGYIFGQTFQDNHTLAFWLAFGCALSITALIELIRWARDRSRPEPQPEAVTEPAND